jgi:hypothetical protein
MPFKGRELVAGRRYIGGESMSSPSEAKSKCQINIASYFHQNKVHSRNKLVPNQFPPTKPLHPRLKAKSRFHIPDHNFSNPLSK